MKLFVILIRLVYSRNLDDEIRSERTQTTPEFTTRTLNITYSPLNDGTNNTGANGPIYFTNYRSNIAILVYTLENCGFQTVDREVVPSGRETIKILLSNSLFVIYENHILMFR